MVVVVGQGPEPVALVGRGIATDLGGRSPRRLRASNAQDRSPRPPPEFPGPRREADGTRSRPLPPPDTGLRATGRFHKTLDSYRYLGRRGGNSLLYQVERRWRALRWSPGRLQAPLGDRSRAASALHRGRRCSRFARPSSVLETAEWWMVRRHVDGARRERTTGPAWGGGNSPPRRVATHLRSPSGARHGSCARWGAGAVVPGDDGCGGAWQNLLIPRDGCALRSLRTGASRQAWNRRQSAIGGPAISTLRTGCDSRSRGSFGAVNLGLTRSSAVGWGSAPSSVQVLAPLRIEGFGVGELCRSADRSATADRPPTAHVEQRAADGPTAARRAPSESVLSPARRARWRHSVLPVAEPHRGPLPRLHVL